MNKIQNKSFSIIVIFTALSIAGLAFIPMLKLQLNPSIPTRDLSVSCSWYGATPIAIEKEVTAPLEAMLNTVPNVTKIRSKSGNNSANITLSFNKHVNLDKARFEVSGILRQAFPKLPDGVSYPTITQYNPDEDIINSPILTYNLNGNDPTWKIQQFAENKIKTRFHDNNGLRNIEVSGGTESAWYIEYNKQQLDVLDINQQDIKNAVNAHFQTHNLGLIETVSNNGKEKLAVYISNRSSHENVIWSNIIIKKTGDRIIRLTDVCKVKHKEMSPRGYFRINGLNSIYLRFYPEKDANHIVLADAVNQRIDELKTQLPENYSLLKSQDTTIYIREELSLIGWRSALTVGILLAFVLLISLNIRYMTILILSLFTNISISFAAYYLLGINIHLYSLAGITISLGLIIDNSIVMIDHIRFHHNKRVYLALLASTLTTMASLSIVLFLPEQLQLNLRDFAFIIIVNLFVSLIISLWYIPALLDRFPIRKKMKKKLFRRQKQILRLNSFYLLISKYLVRFRVLIITGGILLFGIPVFWLPTEWEGDEWYNKAYMKTIGSDFYQTELKKPVEKILGGTLRIFVNNVYEGNYYRDKSETKLYVHAGLPVGTTVQQLNAVLKKMEAFIATYEEVEQFTTSIYSPQSGSITIWFKPEHEKSVFPYMLKGHLTQKAIDFGGMNWNIYGVGQGFYNSTGVHTSRNYSLNLVGYNYDELEHQSKIVRDRLSEHRRVSDIEINATISWSERMLEKFTLEVDPELLNLYEIERTELSQNLNESGLHKQAFTYQTFDDKQEGIILKSEESGEFDRWAVFNRSLSVDDNYKLAFFADIKKESMNPTIHKVNQQYLRKIEYKYNGNGKFGSRFQKKVIDEMNARMPLGYKIERRTWSYWGDSKQKPYHLILIIIIVVFMISAVLFESLRQPLAIVMLIPLSFVGVFLTFYWFDLSFDQGGYASFILLSGLVVNSAIYIINDYNNKLRECKKKGIKISKLKIYMKAFNSKIIPVFLTIVSSVLGLIPFLTLGDEEPFWYAFSAGAIGGLAFSFFLLIVYLPVFLIGNKSSRL